MQYGDQKTFGYSCDFSNKDLGKKARFKIVLADAFETYKSSSGPSLYVSRQYPSGNKDILLFGLSVNPLPEALDDSEGRAQLQAVLDQGIEHLGEGAIGAKMISINGIDYLYTEMVVFSGNEWRIQIQYAFLFNSVMGVATFTYSNSEVFKTRDKALSWMSQLSILTRTMMGKVTLERQ